MKSAKYSCTASGINCFADFYIMKIIMNENTSQEELYNLSYYFFLIYVI